MQAAGEPSDPKVKVPVAPRLSGDLAERFEAWIAAAAEREPLRFPELRKGVQALSARYVERRGEPGATAQALRGAGLRAAFASFYAPLHFLAAYHGMGELPADWRERVRIGSDREQSTTARENLDRITADIPDELPDAQKRMVDFAVPGLRSLLGYE